ncbi:MAG: alpha/beta hydrolase, partial [Actinomycetota bacterium]|nr:alpha/beta hydrolase [Actinomycetota bacterium]
LSRGRSRVRTKRLRALSAAGMGLAAGLAAERLAVVRKRRSDPESYEEFRERRAERSRWLHLDDGTRIFIEETGPEDPRGAVFIHGSALRSDMWHYQLPGLGDHRLIFYDLRGHGLSKPVGDAEFSIHTLAEDLLAVIEDRELEQVVLVGHSIGGMIAMELCHIRPDLVGSPIAGLVLVNTTYRPVVETLAGGALLARVERITRRPFDALGSFHQRIDRLRKIVAPSGVAFWFVAFLGFGPKASAKQIDFTYDMLAETDSDVIFELIKSYREFNVRDVLGDINVPTLVIGGGTDRITLPEASEYIAEQLPDAELRLFPKCGHMTPLQRHDEFNELVTNFLDEILEAKPEPEARAERAGTEAAAQTGRRAERAGADKPEAEAEAGRAGEEVKATEAHEEESARR